MTSASVLDSAGYQFTQAPLFTFRNIITGILVFVLLHVTGKVVYNLYLSPLAGYPGPKLWALSRLLWNYFNMKGRISWKIRELHDQYGPVVRIAPDELSYTTSGAWKKIYGQRNPEFVKALDGRGIAPASIGGQRSLMTEHQDRHLRLRRAIDPAFSQRALREQENYFQDHSDNLIEKLYQRCKKEPLDMTTWYNLVAFDIVSDLAFGEPSGCVNNPDQPWIQAILARAKAIVWFQLAVQYGFMDLLNWLTPKYVVESRKKHIAMTEAKLKARVEAKNPGKDFMSYILENDEKLNHLELVMLSSNFIVAGSGTSAGGMSGLTYLLLRNPDKLEKLKREIRGQFKKRSDMTMQAVTSCKYLRACLNEGMRLYPPTPGSLPRFVPGKGEVIEGKWVPGGYAVGVNQLAAGHSEHNFKRAREFHPERWLDEPDSEFQNDDRSAVQPFSYGQRACIGRSGGTCISLLLCIINATLIKPLRYFIKARRLGCGPVPFELTRWPLGIDLVRRGLQADREQRIPDFVTARFESMGRYTWGMSLLGTSNFITAEPRNVQAILATQFGDFIMGTARRTNLKTALGRSIFAVDGKAWHRSREAMRPIFARDNISRLDLLEEHVQTMFQIIESKKQGSMVDDDGRAWSAPVSLATLLPRLTMDSATELFLGHSTHSLKLLLSNQHRGDGQIQHEEDDFGHAFERMLSILGTRMRLRSLYWLYGNKELSQCIQTLHKFVDNAIDAADQSREQRSSKLRYDFLESLRACCSDRAEVREQVLGLLAAGRDTTASLTAWVFYCLVRNPRIYAKLRETILETFGPYSSTVGQSITFEKLKGCSYLQYVLNETLRLHSVVPFNSRCAVRDTVLPTGGGQDGNMPIFVPKGTEVNFSTHVLHRRKDLWGDDADEFVPERWEKKRPGMTWHPGSPVARDAAVSCRLRVAIE
ncbi:hypothetical protein COCMIDRAFT_32802 [Bipolaris oryzae ATCC 44560]|uniref:Cytochrome P450 n=1 Tax=Bipolaris oryzae ATCC 44560 TaxID=930090 RepID=W7A152_COCMI|nr:uncharacterized protein COCMIDRAFT_32802 [Bipolaris oryzae ATCC 44560]EUC49786.1 hypothetical protein COCMIDRAFT_32802 [Bipolaris oryzae ATCC 44560]